MRKTLFMLLAGALLSAFGPQAAVAKCDIGTFTIDRPRKGDTIAGYLISMTTSSGFAASTYSSAETSGTSGCGKGGRGAALEQQVEFVASSAKRLLEDFARGGGEHADSLAALLGCSPELRGRFAGLMQSRLEALQPDAVLPETIPLLRSIHAEAGVDQTLKAGCPYLT